MSLDDIKKLPLVEDQRIAPLVEIAEVIVQKDWHGDKQNDRFVAYIQGILHKHPQLDNDTDKLSYLHSIRDCSQGRFLQYRQQDIKDIVGYFTIKKL